VDERDEIARQREDFVSRLTHDLRTPLVAADRMLVLLSQGALGELSPPIQEAIVTMIRSNQNLLQMVNTLLEVYRFEAGRKTFAFLPVDLQNLLQEVVQELSPIAQDKGISLQLQQQSIPTARVSGDRLELHRLFTNLIGNAIKFTDKGSVTVRISTNPDSHLQIDVIDTGSGISPEDQATLFQRFRQGSQKRSGSGLGLYLSRRIAEAHQGTLQVESELGKGSTFTARLPVTKELGAATARARSDREN
jgi:signal transduction histidine kinase